MPEGRRAVASRLRSANRSAPGSAEPPEAEPRAPERRGGDDCSMNASHAEQVGQRPSHFGLRYPHCWQ
jgi:hypothetical protein